MNMNKIIAVTSVCLVAIAGLMACPASFWIFHQPEMPKSLQK